MLTGIFFWPFVNALNFKFVALEVRFSFFSPALPCTPSMHPHPSIHPHSCTPTHPQNRPIVGSMSGVVWNVYMSGVINSKSHPEELPPLEKEEGEEEGAVSGGDGGGEGAGWWERWMPEGATAALPGSISSIRFF